MWIFLKEAFLSIVDPDGVYDGSAGPVGEYLLVRARIEGDIEAVFPDATVVKTPERDYRFRALILRADVAQAMVDQVANLGAKNFKGSVEDKIRHDVYMDVWSVMSRWQKSASPRHRQFRR